MEKTSQELAEEHSVRKPEKFILDATAGFRMMWFNKKHPNTIYLDCRPECEPDIVGDFRDLKDFADETFRLIVFDPPHIVKKEKIVSASMLRRFGVLEAETWQSDLKQGFYELWRVLMPYGLLILKWSNFQISSDEIIKLAPELPLFYQVTSSKPRVPKRNRTPATSGTNTVQTLWFCFMKIPKEVSQK